MILFLLPSSLLTFSLFLILQNDIDAFPIRSSSLAWTSLPFIRYRSPQLRRSVFIDNDDTLDCTTLRVTGSTDRDSHGLTNRRTWMEQATQQISCAIFGITAASQSSVAVVADPMAAESVLCDATISLWQKPNGRMLALLGTAHISDVSALLAGALVRRVHPDAVFVELDQKRIQNLPVSDPSDAASPLVLIPALPSTTITTSTVVPMSTSASTPSSPMNAPPPPPTDGWFQRKALNFAGAAVGKAVQGMYSNLSSAGFSPGEEFAAAIRAGREIGATIVLGDQDVQVTLRRLAQALSVTDLQPLLNPDAEFEKTMADLLPLPPALGESSGDTSQFKRDLSEYVERMKSRETVRTIVQEFETVAPAVVRVMLTERDAYMAQGLDSLESFPKVVAVMGLAHIDGVERNLQLRGWMPVRPSCPPK